jgi:hypothetical protein
MEIAAAVSEIGQFIRFRIQYNGLDMALKTQVVAVTVKRHIKCGWIAFSQHSELA